MGVSISATRTKRDDYVRLGSEHQSLSLNSLPASQRELITKDPVLSGLVHDQVIRGEDFGKMFDRLNVLDAQSAKPSTSASTSLGRADAMYSAAKSALGTPSVGSSSAATRTRMGLFAAPASPQATLDAKFEKAIDEATKLEKQGKLGDAAAKWQEAAELRRQGAYSGTPQEHKSGYASYSAHAGDLYKQQAEQLAAKGDSAGAKSAYKNAGDSYAKAVKNTALDPNLATLEHWSREEVADWGLEGIECYQKAGLSIQKNGGARTIGDMDVDKVEKGVNGSSGFDMGLERGNRMMRLGDAYLKSGDKAAALGAYKNAKYNYDDAIKEDKKMYPIGLPKHTLPAEKAQLKIAVLEASIAQDAGTKFPPTDYRAHLLTADGATGMNKADALSRALQSRKPPMPEELKAEARRQAIDAVSTEMKGIEKTGTDAQKAEYAEKAALYFDAFGDAAKTKEAQAMAARANLKLGDAATNPKSKAELYEKAARQMELSGAFSQADAQKTHEKAAANYMLAAAAEKNLGAKAGLLGKAGTEYRAAGKEQQAVAAFREGAKQYLAAAKENPSIATSKTPGAVTVADLDGSPQAGEGKANTLGLAASLYQKAGSKADLDAATALRTRSEALHNLALREKFKDKVFVPPVALDNGEITPKSIADYENAILKKNGGDYSKAAAEFEALRDKQVGANGTNGPQFHYFNQASERMNRLDEMKKAGVQNLSNPPTSKNFADYAKARAEFWRKQTGGDGLPLTERAVAEKVAEELQIVADPFYGHRNQVGKDVDYQAGAKNIVTSDLSGRQQCDCEVYAYDVGLAMEAAGFKCSTETRDPKLGGDSHVILNLQGKDGSAAGSLSNGQYYGSADDAFTSVGLPPGTTKDAVIKKREDDAKAPKL